MDRLLLNHQPDDHDPEALDQPIRLSQGEPAADQSSQDQSSHGHADPGQIVIEPHNPDHGEAGHPRAHSGNLEQADLQEPNLRQPRPEEPGPEQARHWRFDQPTDTEARHGASARVAGGSGPGTALVPSGHEWDDRSGEPPGWDVIGFLWRRKLRIGLVAALSMACFTFAIYQVPESYRASSEVIFQGDHPSASRDDDAQREPAFAADTLSNEVELLTSEELLSKVAVTLDLVHNPEFYSAGRIMPEWLAPEIDRLKETAAGLRSRLGLGTGAEPSPVSTDAPMTQALEVLRNRLTIAPIGISRVIRITAQTHDARFAATLANTVAAAYADTRANAKTLATSEAHHWIEQRLQALHERALRSARAFDTFRHDSGAVRGKDGTISQEQVTQVSTELTQVRQARSTLQLTLAQTSSGGGSDADLDALTSASGSLLLPRLREQLAVATARRAELAATGGPELPAVMANQAQVADITRSIARERARIRATWQSKLAVALSNEQRLGAALDALKGKVELADSSGAQMQALEREANADSEIYRNFVSRAEQTDPDLTYQPPSVQVLSRAVVPIHAAAPNKRILLPGALLLSLGVGTAAAFVKEHSRRGVISLRDLPRPGGQPPLGMLPLVRRRRRRMARVWGEAVAQILARMLLPVRGVPPASILVTSALPREGKTRLALALAAAATKRGMRVLLIDADLRRRSISKAAGLSRCDVSLVRLLEGEIAVDEAPVYHAGWGFAVLAAGEPNGSPVNLFATDAWESALRDLEGMFDLVIIDTPPALAVGDTWMMARHADATAIVAEWGSTPAPTIELAIEQLSTAQARLLGVVLTKVAHREHASYGYDDSVVFSPQLLRYHGRRGRL